MCGSGARGRFEIELAMEQGYRVVAIYEVWHFEQVDKNLFASYIEIYEYRKEDTACLIDAL